MRKRRANYFPPIPRKVEEFDNLLKNPVFRTIDGNTFYATFASANDELALILLADIVLSFLNRIHSVNVDATFKVVPVNFYQPLIIHYLVLDTITPVFYVLMSGKTRLCYDAVFPQNQIIGPIIQSRNICFRF